MNRVLSTASSPVESGTLNVVALTPGRKTPSARFRIRQYGELMSRHGITLNEYCPPVSQMIRLPSFLGSLRRRYLFPWLIIQFILNIICRLPGFFAARRADITIINRSVIPGLEEAVKWLPSPKILDVDDSIWLTDPRGKKSAVFLAKNVDAIIAGNKYLAEWYSQFNKKIFLIPTGVDVQKYRPLQFRTKVNRCTIGWMGTDGNFPNLNVAKTAIENILHQNPTARMLIVSNKRPANWHIDGSKIVFRLWHEDTELNDLQEMDIGIMPLIDSAWTKGKCSFKMLQYMSVGIPVIVSPVGMNNEVLSKDNLGYAASTTTEWEKALSKLINNKKMREEMGNNGRKVVEKYYSIETTGRQLAEALFKIAERNVSI